MSAVGFFCQLSDFFSTLGQSTFGERATYAAHAHALRKLALVLPERLALVLGFGC